MLGLLFSSLTLAAFNHFNDAEIRFMQRVYLQHNQDISNTEVRQRLYENQFLLSQATQLFPEQVARQSKVGFNTQYHVERYLNTLFTSQLKLPTYSPKIDFQRYDEKWLTHALGRYPSDGNYSAEQINKLQSIKLNKLFKPAPSLYEFIEPLSMQVRFRLHQGDIELFKSEVLKKHKFQFNLTHASKILATQNIAMKNLYVIAQGDILRSSIQGWLGIKGMMHSQSPLLEKFEQQISNQEIQKYYSSHKNNFKYLSNVTAHGAAFTEREQAVKFRQQAVKHTFKEALNITNSNDIYNRYGNTLDRKNNSNWSVQLAFTQQENNISSVVRSPQGQWVVVLSNNHQYEYFTVNDETVRYQAKKALAIDKAQKSYQQNWLAWQQRHGVEL